MKTSTRIAIAICDECHTITHIPEEIEGIQGDPMGQCGIMRTTTCIKDQACEGDIVFAGYIELHFEKVD